MPNPMRNDNTKGQSNRSDSNQGRGRQGGESNQQGRSDSNTGGSEGRTTDRDS